ncbi:iron ABC transporter substrate-binding protein [Mesorhizobium sp. B1-1-4]|uniref:iron ABC transporter substrate-binding protein n=1 Tax=Mesorhizobium sp. B1-1-4 TaxID=2589980 RepID=UPI00112A7FE1|nr:iron ABC transporter substrate-binding protein [Mesorhizobium sp. B1-1-4]TPN44459.1 iron ABC transporter substrate-binding protein [Mesorhizobium sp. B1-1-4]
MSVSTASETKVYIGPTTPAADAAAYAALTWVEIGEVQSVGEFGDQANDVTFTSLSDGRVRHLKGARDAGALALVCGRDALDLGQVAARAAEKTKFAYAIKIVAADALDANDTDSIFYFHALVQSARNNFGENDAVVTTTFNLGIVTAIIEVPATVVA